MFIVPFRQAAGEGAVVELKLRLLDSREPELQPFVDEKLESVEEEIVKVFSGRLSADEREQLRLCRQLRNKILHCDFSKARAKLHEMGAPQVRGGVRMIRLMGTPSESIVQRLTDAMSDKPGAFECVADTGPGDDAGVFGWLIELATSGDLARATAVFRQTAGIVDRLAGEDRDA